MEVPNRVFVGGLPFDAREEQLFQFFSYYGTVRSIKIIRDSSSISKGYGFVSFSTEEEADNVISKKSLYYMEKRLNFGKAVSHRSTTNRRGTDVITKGPNQAYYTTRGANRFASPLKPSFKVNQVAGVTNEDTSHVKVVGGMNNDEPSFMSSTGVSGEEPGKNPIGSLSFNEASYEMKGFEPSNENRVPLRRSSKLRHPHSHTNSVVGVNVPYDQYSTGAFATWYPQQPAYMPVQAPPYFMAGAGGYYPPPQLATYYDEGYDHQSNYVAATPAFITCYPPPPVIGHSPIVPSPVQNGWEQFDLNYKYWWPYTPNSYYAASPAATIPLAVEEHSFTKSKFSDTKTPAGLDNQENKAEKGADDSTSPKPSP